MAYHPPALDNHRKAEICRAFAELYDSIPRNKRGELLASGKALAQYGFAFKRGILLPTPAMLVVCYERTNDPRFLFTKQEKEAHLRIVGGTLPDAKCWPDREAVSVELPTELPNIPDLGRQFVALVEALARLAKLPAKHPAREEAQRLLVKPAMRLYAATTALGLEFPEEFRDLINQLDFATNLNPGASKRRR